MKEKIKQLYTDISEEIISIRRYLHQHPELSFKEEETSLFIQKKLREAGIRFKTGYAQTGILATIQGENPGKRHVVLRGDMDALPIQEDTGLQFASVHPGVMHACGHDVHTSCVLGAALMLNKLKTDFEGSIHFLFQPGEELLPGGASLMMKDGVFDDFTPDIIIGQHVYPDLEPGKIGYRPGMYMASSDEIYITVKGNGGHAALPHKVVDTVYIASQIIVNMQQIVSRKADTRIPTVLSFGNIIGKGATNIIPREVNIDGTFRTMNEEWRAEAHRLIHQIAEGTAKSLGGECEVKIIKGYPCVVNNKEATEKAFNFTKELFGDLSVVELDLRMTAEDFGYYSQKYPSVFYRLGTKTGNDQTGLHTPGFKIDEDSIPFGVQNMVYLALNFSRHQ